MATIFTPQNPSPRNEVRDMSIAQIFTVIIDGVKCTDYQIRIYKVSDNTLVYNSTKLTLGSPLSDGQTLSHTITGGSVTNTGTDSYKWTIQVWNASETVTSREFQFFAKTTPVLTFTPPATVTTQSYTFTATVAQAQGDIVNNYVIELYDTNQVFIESSGTITSFNISHEFDGFANGDDLYVKVYGTTTGRQTFSSGLINFDVVYSQPSINLKPEVIVDNETSLVTISRGDVVQILGTTSGITSYTNDFIYTGNTGLELYNSAYVNFNVAIPLDFTLTYKWKPLSNTFSGVLISLDNGVYEVGYNLGSFYYTINGTTITTAPVDIYGSIFYIVLLPTKVEFMKFEFYTQLSDFTGDTLGDLVGTTLADIGLI